MVVVVAVVVVTSTSFHRKRGIHRRLIELMERRESDHIDGFRGQEGVQAWGPWLGGSGHDTSEHDIETKI